jgi:hypothetical protein
MPERSDRETDLALLQEMGVELHRLFVAQEQTRRAGWSRRRPGQSRRPGVARFNVRVAVLLVLLLLALTAVALAAGGLLSGSPVKAPYRLIPTSGSGVPIASSVELTALSVADPAGGPPWGLRAMKTTRGLGCLQFGRLVEGRLSVLGQDGAFGDDRRFHELPADVFDDLGCATLDAHGNLFVAVSRQGVPASAYEEGCSPPVHGIVPAPGQPTCQAKDERALYYGALGPDAESITYATFGGRSITVPTVGPEGAYLIVTYAPPHADPNVFGAGSPNGSAILPSGSRQPIRAIAYRNGTVCHIGRPRGPRNPRPPLRPRRLRRGAGEHSKRTRAAERERPLQRARATPGTRTRRGIRQLHHWPGGYAGRRVLRGTPPVPLSR